MGMSIKRRAIINPETSADSIISLGSRYNFSGFWTALWGWNASLKYVDIKRATKGKTRINSIRYLMINAPKKSIAAEA